MSVISMQDRIDVEMREPLELLLQAMPGGLGSIPDIVARRQAFDALLAQMRAARPPVSGVVAEDQAVPGLDDDPALSVRVFRPAALSGTAPCIFHIHGGGMVVGTVAGEAMLCEVLVLALGCVVVSVEYRLAPEHPYPAAPRDCYAALRWTAANADRLGIDAERIAIYGGSAGGGLAIATALLARDQGGPDVRYLMAIYPMIDDRNESPSSQEIVDIGVWDRSTNLEAWGWYLGGQPADGYAAPSRMDDLTGLPPTFIDVGELDLFRDEDITFAARLLQAGIPTELHVYPGSFHAGEGFAPEAALAQRIVTTRIEALRRTLV